ncbi:MAG: FitA-like ribbon-helix-helix domain-containing protein [Blastocatellia bacterium]
MASVLARNIGIGVLEKLKAKAASKGRSLQVEVNEILTEAAGRREPLSEIEIARKIRSSLRVRSQSNSADLLREDRAR